MAYLVFAVTSTVAQGAARLTHPPVQPTADPFFAPDPLILIAAAALVIAIWAAWWGGLLTSEHRH